MKIIVGFFLLVCIALSTGFVLGESPCVTSDDCPNEQGENICYGKKCNANMPCNKDNDCLFWATADWMNGNLHALCYDTPDIKQSEGYGTCLFREKADGKYTRKPGADVEALLEA